MEGCARNMKAAAISVNLDNPAEYSIDIFEGRNPIKSAHAFILGVKDDTPSRQWTVTADTEAIDARILSKFREWGLEDGRPITSWDRENALK